MINVIALTVALVVWIVLWAIGAKALDAALIPGLIVAGAAAAYTYLPLLRKTLGHDQ